ncbi:MAG: AMP-binding protein [Gemmatimonadetes bacterium]|jgi:acetyl-CoA synthetase|nr:AMP-binding protein [Gemmatimonadota bacterium]MBT6620331.1 AMP-binding protein [Gemmatimonadota bacterium]MBT7418558.1 AMP-binding protein [Gemmatimonadota bacterium]MBT7549874.1 AMP-binding protein [Gemmatimonadota bacterium]
MLRREDLMACGLDEVAAAELLLRFEVLVGSPEARWREVARRLLRPDHPFALHQLLYEVVYDGELGPVFFPEPADIEGANATALQRELDLPSYDALFAWSVDEWEVFWHKTVARLGIRLQKPYERFVDLAQGPTAPEWLAGAEMNIAESCFQADGEQTAIVFQREGGPLEHMSYTALEGVCDRVASGLVAAGFVPGDRIAVDMPMTAEAVAIYLGIVKAGCAVVAIADSFAAAEIATRLKIGSAQAVFTQDVILRGGRELPLYSRLVEAQAPRAIVLSGRVDGTLDDLRDGDLRWEDFLREGDGFSAVARSPDEITNILFSSGTTGAPKALPWTHIHPIKCGADAHYHQDVHPGDVVAWPTNLGWMMGPWLIYAAFLNRATMALYYGAPTERGFGEFIRDAEVSMLGVIPSMVRTWRGTGCMEGIDFSAICAFSATGECSNAEDMHYLMALSGYRPILEYCGGTELAGGYLLSTLVKPVAPSTFNSATLGTDLVILDEAGEVCDRGEVFLLPPAIGMSSQVLNRDHHEVYYEGVPGLHGVPLRRHGDQVERLSPGRYRVHGRADDTMNLGGIKVSSAEIERVVNGIDGVVETAAIAVPPPGGGPSLLVVYAVLDGGGDDWQDTMQQVLRGELNPLFKIHEVVVVEALPRTASNKVMRRVLREMHGRDEET